MRIDYILESEDGNLISKGRLGTSARTGEKRLSTNIEIPELKGKKINLILKDQNKKVIYSRIYSL